MSNNYRAAIWASIASDTLPTAGMSPASVLLLGHTDTLSIAGGARKYRSVTPSFYVGHLDSP